MFKKQLENRIHLSGKGFDMVHFHGKCHPSEALGELASHFLLYPEQGLILSLVIGQIHL